MFARKPSVRLLKQQSVDARQDALNVLRTGVESLVKAKDKRNEAEKLAGEIELARLEAEVRKYELEVQESQAAVRTATSAVAVAENLVNHANRELVDAEALKAANAANLELARQAVQTLKKRVK